MPIYSVVSLQEHHTVGTPDLVVEVASRIVAGFVVPVEKFFYLYMVSRNSSATEAIRKHIASVVRQVVIL